MTLYEIDSNIRQIIENGFVCDEETGEILFLQDDIEHLNAEKKKKIESIAIIIKERTLFADEIGNEIKTLTERKKRVEREADRLKAYLDMILDGEKFDTPRCSVTYRKSEQVDFDDIENIPDEYIRLDIKKSADKVAMKKALKSGVEIEGVRIVENRNINVK